MFGSIYNYFYPISDEPSDKQKRLRHLVMTQMRNTPKIQGILSKPYDPYLKYELERLTAHSKIHKNKKRKRNKKHRNK